jgi:hypothetical protein
MKSQSILALIGKAYSRDDENFADDAGGTVKYVEHTILLLVFEQSIIVYLQAITLQPNADLPRIPLVPPSSLVPVICALVKRPGNDILIHHATHGLFALRRACRRDMMDDGSRHGLLVAQLERRGISNATSDDWCE